MPKVAVSVANSDIFVIPFCSKCNAEPPNTEKKISVTSVGANKTPAMNCLMVRPLETRAINIPTNGAHEIHHAQYKIVQSLIHCRFTSFTGFISYLISRQFLSYFPIVVVNKFKIYMEGPTINNVQTRAVANHILIVLKCLIPFPKPDHADMIKSTVAIIKMIS